MTQCIDSYYHDDLQVIVGVTVMTMMLFKDPDELIDPEEEMVDPEVDVDPSIATSQITVVWRPCCAAEYVI